MCDYLSKDKNKILNSIKISEDFFWILVGCVFLLAIKKI